VRRLSLIGSLAIALFVLAASAAFGAQQRTDPKASSPAGVIYEIPFDSARKDAAPQSARDGSSTSGDSSAAAAAAAGGSGSGGSGDGGAGDGSSSADGGSDANAGAGAGGAAGSDPNVGTSIHSENGFGSSSQVPGVGGATVQGDGPPSSALRTASSATDASPVGTYGMLGVVVLAGGWIGIAAARGLRL
jgi:hypothetical protein